MSNMKSAAPLALLIGLVTIGCSDAGSVSKSIGRIVREQNAQELRLTAATPFQWDKVYFFHPYTPRSTICESLSVQVKYCERIVPKESKDDGVMSLAFLSGARVVHYELHARWNGDFTPVPANQAISSEAAVFQVVPSGTAVDGSAWLTLVPK
ncbi:hypothetical protein [Paucibacter sp. M5-1]|uniref:hypothetical protein n=1 Tax=Paucibacter sp. M5-1 TaxID=3015998 RepID=UPI0022B8F31D|nr:hypothetical protein [Paucibacter sp. M5-1]MCZ7880131.1 hypothetical protein [Paucibacter sp. M5-1]